MAHIELRGLAHAYRPNPSQASDYALQPFSMEWRDGGAFALLGPSGCGKSTLLNIISGLLRPSQGQVLFDGQDVTALPPQRRNIAQVFQFPVIYDTMTVEENLAFPLRNRGVDRATIQRRVGRIAEMLELTPDLRRRAIGLSADAKQKISLGRGLVREDVAAVLFDEPLTVIDPHLKWKLRRKLKEIHRELKLTLIYVTHDQIEALTFADEVVVMSTGRVVQVGTAEELFESPAHSFVGHFIGSPGMNFLPIQWDGQALRIAGEPLGMPLPPEWQNWLIGESRVHGDDLLAGIRPEYLVPVDSPRPGAVAAQVERIQDLGTGLLVTARIGAQVVRLRAPSGSFAAPGSAIWLQVLGPRTCYYGHQEQLPLPPGRSAAAGSGSPTATDDTASNPASPSAGASA